MLDHDWGVRPDVSGRYQHARVECVGVRLSRRWHRPESWAQVRFAQAVSARLNPLALRLTRADALLDLSGGDSFTDMYGPVRLAKVERAEGCRVSRAGTPVVLLPQTYGPFDTAAGRSQATRLVRRSALAYARDPLSHQRLLELAGQQADTSRCRPGVDVAFALRPREAPIHPQLAELLGESATVTVGVNVSGLLCDASASERFGLAGDYLATMTALTRGLIADGAFVVFVPHVHEPGVVAKATSRRSQH